VNENRKNKIKNIAIIILGITTIVSTAFAIYYGRSSSVDYANQLRNTINRLELHIDELTALHAEQGIQLTHVINELREATYIVSELRGDNERAIELVRRSDERLIELERGMAAAGTTIDGLIARQYLINEYVRAQSAENRELRKALGISN